MKCIRTIFFFITFVRNYLTFSLFVSALNTVVKTYDYFFYCITLLLSRWHISKQIDPILFFLLSGIYDLKHDSILSMTCHGVQPTKQSVFLLFKNISLGLLQYVYIMRYLLTYFRRLPLNGSCSSSSVPFSTSSQSRTVSEDIIIRDEPQQKQEPKPFNQIPGPSNVLFLGNFLKFKHPDKSIGN